LRLASRTPCGGEKYEDAPFRNRNQKEQKSFTTKKEKKKILMISKPISFNFGPKIRNV